MLCFASAIVVPRTLRCPRPGCSTHSRACVRARACTCSYAFADFGPAHTVRDGDGEAVRSAIVVAVENTNPVLVLTHDAKRHGFADGDNVVFREVRASASVCVCVRVCVRVCVSVCVSGGLRADSPGSAAFLCSGLVVRVWTMMATRMRHRLRA